MNTIELDIKVCTIKEIDNVLNLDFDINDELGQNFLISEKPITLLRLASCTGRLDLVRYLYNKGVKI